jgi:hypothetical protein
MMRLTSAAQTSQMYTLGPATNFDVCAASLPQKEQASGRRANIAATAPKCSSARVRRLGNSRPNEDAETPKAAAKAKRDSGDPTPSDSILWMVRELSPEALARCSWDQDFSSRRARVFTPSIFI